MTEPYIIVIGASQGGIQALSTLVSSFPSNLPATIFIVLHSSPDYKSHLDEVLSTKGALPVIQPQNGEKIKTGTIYVAPSNRHLVVKYDHVNLPFGPHENRSRPSIDVLFRSAAAYHTSRVIAVLLTGYLDDGVSGLSAVKRCGGKIIVQDPNDAEVPDLPKNAIRSMEIDHILPLKEIAAQLIDIVHQPFGDPVAVPEEIMADIKVSEHTVPGLERMNKLGTITPYTCPDCGGTLWDAKNEPAGRLVCHTGHSFTIDSFLKGQAEVIEDSLWAAIRFFDERIKILENLAEKDHEKLHLQSTQNYRKKIKELKYHMQILRDFVVSGGLTVSN